MTTAGLRHGSQPCQCTARFNAPRLIAVTGGPGAGKSAVLEMAARAFCSHVAILPESATIIFGGGFPRGQSVSYLRAAQRAIFHVQRELERMAIEDESLAIVLCDRGTLDGIAYWPGDPAEFWSAVGSSQPEELSRYHAVLHLETPLEGHGYNHQNNLRTETADEAHRIDLRIANVWAGHPRRQTVSWLDDFPGKALRALDWLRAQLPPGI
jgi:predicted ATPase